MVQLGSKPGTWVSAQVLFIASSLQDEKKLAAAKKFIQYLSDNGATWADAGHVPARISVQEKLDPKVYVSNVVFGKSFQDFGVFVDPQNPNVSELTNAYDPEITAAMSGQKTVKQALDDAAKRMQAVLDRTK
jgi:multiple sugar transport system substrate-binding protein